MEMMLFPLSLWFHHLFFPPLISSFLLAVLFGLCAAAWLSRETTSSSQFVYRREGHSEEKDETEREMIENVYTNM